MSTPKRQLKSPLNKRSLVANAIRSKIKDGELVAGERLATVRELCAAFSVSISVVQNALRDLCNNSFIECRGASGYFISESASEGDNSIKDGDSGTRIFLMMNHHSDLIWRYDLAGYAAIRDEQLLALFRYASKHSSCAFAFEQAHIAKVFLEAHPELLPAARRLVAEKRLDLGGIYSIPDLNMISGESIIRNLEAGRNTYLELFAVEPHYIRMADAFGMCSQLPQIMLHCGQQRLMPGRTPNSPREVRHQPFFRWHSLAGNGHLLVFQSAAYITHLGYKQNVPLIQDYDNRITKNIRACQAISGNALVVYETEETVLRESIFPIVVNANRTGRKPIIFSSASVFLEQVNPEEPSFPDYTGEFNPTLTGCYTTRIGVKQRIRTAENRLMLAEMLDVLEGGGKFYDFQWRQLFIAQFHDGVCGCHSDAAYIDVDKALNYATPEITDVAGDGITVVSYSGCGDLQPVIADRPPDGIAAQRDDEGKYHFVTELPQCGTRFFPVAAEVPAGRPAEVVFENRWLKADFTGAAPEIVAKNTDNPFAKAGFGEILFRNDTGSMWCEEYWSSARGREYQEEKLVASIDGPVFHEFVTEGHVIPGSTEDGNAGNHWPGFESLSFRKEYCFYHELEYFTLRLTLDWKGRNTKIAVSFPTTLDPLQATSTYETPFAATVRKPYFEVPEKHEKSFQPLAADSDYASARGDWPALNWVQLADFSRALSVANTGTPGHQITNGEIVISLLRSGTKTADGGLTPPDGAMDNGIHQYEFAFHAHSTVDTTAPAKLGFLLNRKAVAINGKLPEKSLLQWDAPNLALSALRRMPDGRILVRFYETQGMAAELKLQGSLPGNNPPEPANAFGTPLPPSSSGMIFAPMEIKTFLL